MKSSLASRVTGPRFGRLALLGGRLAGGMLTLMGLALPAARAMAQTESQQTPMEVTTDTPEYCRQLADRVHTLEVASGVTLTDVREDLPIGGGVVMSLAAALGLYSAHLYRRSWNGRARYLSRGEAEG